MKFVYTTLFAFAAATMAAPGSEILVEKRCLGAGGMFYHTLAEYFEDSQYLLPRYY